MKIEAKMKKILILSIALILVSGLVFLAKSADIDNVANWLPTANPKDRHMVISSNGTIVVFYQGGSDPPAPGIRAKKSTDSGATWTNLEGGSGSTQVSESGTIYYSVCFDANDNIYVAYNKGDGTFYHMNIYFKKLTYSSGNWSVGEERAVVDVMGIDGTAYPSIVRESGGRIWIAYGYWIASSDAGLVRATYSDNEFQTPGIVTDVNSAVSAPYASHTPALTIRNGYPFIVYADYPGSQLKWSYWTGSSWASPGLVVYGTVHSLSFSVAMRGSEVHVVYYASYEGIKHIYYNGSSWVTTGPAGYEKLSMGPNGQNDEDPSLTTDGSDLWCFASVHYGPGKYDIKYKKWHNSFWDTNWTAITTDTANNRYSTTPSSCKAYIPLAWSLINGGGAFPNVVKFTTVGIPDTTIAPQFNYTIKSSTSAKTSLSFQLTIELIDSTTGDRMNDASNQFKISAWIDGPNGSEQAPGSWRIVEGGTTLVNGQAVIKVTYDTVGKIRFKVEDDPGHVPRYPAWPAFTELIDIQPLRLRYEVVAPEKVQAGKEFSLTIRLIDDPDGDGKGTLVTPIDYARRVSLVAYSTDTKRADGVLKLGNFYLQGGEKTIIESYNIAQRIYIKASDAEDKDPAAEAGRSRDIEVIGAPETVMKLEGLYNETKDALYLRNSTLINIVCISEIKAKYIYYIDNGSQRKTYEEPFSLSPGAHTIEYYGVDEYGNQEKPNKSKRIYVAFFGDNADGLTNIPNPFKAGREETSIEYKLKETSNVTITIYDLLGQEVWRKSYPAGENGGKESNRVSWDGRNLSGKVVANGGYVCRIWIAREKRYMVRKIGVAK